MTGPNPENCRLNLGVTGECQVDGCNVDLVPRRAEFFGQIEYAVVLHPGKLVCAALRKLKDG